MKVKLNTSVAGRKDGMMYSYEAGQIVEIEDHVAERMIAKGRAELVATEKKIRKSKVDTD
jgi:hypothetical protein